MSRAQLEAAQKLAAITGKPISDFYKLPAEEHVIKIETCSCGQQWDEYGVCHGNHKDGEQREEESMEASEEDVSDEVQMDTSEIRDNKEQVDNVVSRVQDTPTDLLEQYGGEIINGRLLNTTNKMSRKDYLAEKKKFKTLDDFWNSPLLYVMFRSEEQIDSNFVNWTTSVELEIKKRENKK